MLSYMALESDDSNYECCLIERVKIRFTKSYFLHIINHTEILASIVKISEIESITILLILCMIYLAIDV